MKKNLVNLFLLMLTQLVAGFKALNTQLTPAYLKRLTNTLGIVGVFVATAILVNEPLRNELLSWAEEILNEELPKCHELIDQESARQLWSNFLTGKSDHTF
jgi:hypothetical protein